MTRDLFAESKWFCRTHKERHGRQLAGTKIDTRLSGKDRVTTMAGTSGIKEERCLIIAQSGPALFSRCLLVLTTARDTRVMTSDSPRTPARMFPMHSSRSPVESVVMAPVLVIVLCRACYRSDHNIPLEKSAPGYSPIVVWPRPARGRAGVDESRVVR